MTALEQARDWVQRQRYTSGAVFMAKFLLRDPANLTEREDWWARQRAYLIRTNYGGPYAWVLEEINE